MLVSNADYRTASQLLLLNAIAPAGTLGQINGIEAAQWAAFASIAPLAWSSLFAAGVHRQILRSHLVFIVLLVYAIGYNAFVRLKSRNLVQAQRQN